MFRKVSLIIFVLLLASILEVDAQRVRLRAQITPDCTSVSGNIRSRFSDIYADGNIAVQGTYSCRGAFIYDISNPDAPVQASWYNPSPPQAFLEAIVIGNRGYFGAGTGGGVHIVDLTNPYQPVLLGVVDAAHGNAFNGVHEIVVFEQNGATLLVENYNFCCGAGTIKTLKVINVTDPANPVFVRDIMPTDPKWIHAMHIRGNRMFTSGWGSGVSARGRTEIYDISNITTQAPALIGYVEDPNPNMDAGNQMHSAWTSEDGNYLYSAREVTNSNGPTPGDIRVYDIHNPAQPLLVNSISMLGLGIDAITPHNPVVMGNYLYVSWYQAGVQVFDLTDPAAPVRVGQYDTFQSPSQLTSIEKTSGTRLRKARTLKSIQSEPWDMVCGAESLQNSLPTEYDGNWAVFPFLGQDKILAGDLASGLIILDSSAIAQPLKNRAADFDGDRRTDLSVFRPSTGLWQVERSGDSHPFTLRTRFGVVGDQISAGDYDGDGAAEFAVFSPSNAQWTIRQMNSPAKRPFFSGIYGLPGDIAVPADFDADGRTDIAVWRPSDGGWRIRRSTLGEASATLGSTGDEPLTGDYDGDGKADIATWRPSDGFWTLRHSTTGVNISFQWGQNGDKPLTADFDGNGISDLVTFRPSTGEWFIRDARTGATMTLNWGTNGDIPLPADYDGDGLADLCVFRPSTNEWRRVNSSDAATVIRVFGQTGDVPVPLSVQPQ